MENKKCSICGTVYQGVDVYELKKHFSSNSRNRDGLDTRCKKCKNEMAKKYRVSNAGNEEYREKYKDAYDMRKKANKYAYTALSRLQTDEIADGIEYLETRLLELKKELKKRTNETM